MTATGGPPHYITTPQGSTVPLVAQLVHSVLSFLLYMESLLFKYFTLLIVGCFGIHFGMIRI